MMGFISSIDDAIEAALPLFTYIYLIFSKSDLWGLFFSSSSEFIEMSSDLDEIPEKELELYSAILPRLKDRSDTKLLALFRPSS